MKLRAILPLTLASIVLVAVPAGAIVGGNATSPDQYPYYVRLLIHKYEDLSKSSECGGSVIDTGWILTAAHCITHDLERDAITIDVFIHDTYRYDAIGLIIHPLWTGDVSDGHDLALVRVPSYATEAGGGIPEATKVRVGAPADPGSYADGVVATVVGHGFTQEGGSLTPELRDLHTPLHSDDYMDDIYNPWYWFSDWNAALMIGAGWTNQTACNGDSGGPLTVDRGGVTVQVGVVSFGPSHWYNGVETCDQPAGYAELSGAQMAWVAATVPGVAARWGSCAASYRGLLDWPGQWVATYVDTGNDAAGPDKDGTFRWTVSCVWSDPVKTIWANPMTRSGRRVAY